MPVQLQLGSTECTLGCETVLLCWHTAPPTLPSCRCVFDGPAIADNLRMLPELRLLALTLKTHTACQKLISEAAFFWVGARLKRAVPSQLAAHASSDSHDQGFTIVQYSYSATVPLLVEIFSYELLDSVQKMAVEQAIQCRNWRSWYLSARVERAGLRA